MMKKKKHTYGNSMRWKVPLLILGVVLFVGLLIFQNEKAKQRKYIEEEVKEETQEEEKTQEEAQQEEKTQKHDNTGEDVPESGTPEEQSEMPEEQEVNIVNLDEYATRIMGENTGLLNKRLTEWVEEYELNAKEGSIIYVMVPQSDPQSINFYIRLSDERGSLVLLAYHPRENVVTASICNYTEEEIKEEVWEADNGPAVRDVSPEEDINVEQEGVEEDDITGEN